MENHEEIAQMKENLLRQLFADDPEIIQTGIQINAGLKLFNDDALMHYMFMALHDRNRMYLNYDQKTPTEIQIYATFFKDSDLKKFKENRIFVQNNLKRSETMRRIIGNGYSSPKERLVYHANAENQWFWEMPNHVIFFRLQTLRSAYQHYFDTNSDECQERGHRYHGEIIENRTLTESLWHYRKSTWGDFV